MNIISYGNSHIGRIRGANEDYFFHEQISGNEFLYIVADGMGGHRAGDVASKLGAKSFAGQYKRKRKNAAPVPEAMAESIEFANQAILDLARSDPAKKGMGTTFSALVILNRKIFIVHVGDSRIYRIRNNEMKLLTTDQTFVAKMVSEGRISVQEAREHPQKNILYMSLGARSHFSPQLIENITVKDGDIFVMCSDGLSGMMGDSEIRSYAEAYSPREAVEGLIRRANEKGGVDNITAQIIRIGPQTTLEETVSLKKIDRRKKTSLILLLIFLAVASALVLFSVNLWERSGSGQSGDTAGIVKTFRNGLKLREMSESKKLAAWMKQNEPDLVFFSAGSLGFLRRGNFFLEIFGKPGPTEAAASEPGDVMLANSRGMLLLWRKKGLNPDYSVVDGLTGAEVMRISPKKNDSGQDDSPDTVFLNSEAENLMPVFFTGECLVFRNSRKIWSVFLSDKKNRTPEITSAELDYAGYPGFSHLRAGRAGIEFSFFSVTERKIYTLKLLNSGETVRHVLDYYLIGNPLAVECRGNDRFVYYFSDHYVTVSGNRMTGDKKYPSDDGTLQRISRVLTDPVGTGRILVDESGGFHLAQLEND